MKVTGKILSALAILCYILILGILFIAAPMVSGYKPVVVLTGSMAPLYPVGTVIYYKPAAFESIQVDDVISFSKNDDAKSVVTHRVVSIDTKRQKITTKGDANENPDPSPISYTDVKGKVMNYHLPYVGYAVQYAQNYFIIGAVFIILLAKLVFDRVAGKKTDGDKISAGAAEKPAENPAPPEKPDNPNDVQQ